MGDLSDLRPAQAWACTEQGQAAKVLPGSGLGMPNTEAATSAGSPCSDPAGPLPFPTCRCGCRMRPRSHVGGPAPFQRNRSRQAGQMEAITGGNAEPSREAGGWGLGEADKEEGRGARSEAGTQACPTQAGCEAQIQGAGRARRQDPTQKRGLYHQPSGKTVHTLESKAPFFFHHRPNR